MEPMQLCIFCINFEIKFRYILFVIHRNNVDQTFEKLLLFVNVCHNPYMGVNDFSYSPSLTSFILCTREHTNVHLNPVVNLGSAEGGRL